MSSMPYGYLTRFPYRWEFFKGNVNPGGPKENEVITFSDEFFTILMGCVDNYILGDKNDELYFRDNTYGYCSEGTINNLIARRKLIENEDLKRECVRLFPNVMRDPHFPGEYINSTDYCDEDGAARWVVEQVNWERKFVAKYGQLAMPCEGFSALYFNLNHPLNERIPGAPYDVDPLWYQNEIKVLNTIVAEATRLKASYLNALLEHKIPIPEPDALTSKLVTDDIGMEIGDLIRKYSDES